MTEPLKHGSLFSGIGGFELAAEAMGWQNVFSVEYDEFCSKILEHHFPLTKHYNDIKQFNAKPYRGSIDIITGGFPCQPFSSAGKRGGVSDNRYLWPEMLRVIREVRPRFVVAENVRGLVNWSEGMVFETVLTDLESEGFEVFPVILPAAGVNAPHRRDRIWFIAYRNNAPTKHHIPTGRDVSASTLQQSATDTKNSGYRGGSGEERQERRKGLLQRKCEGSTLGREIEGCSRIWNAPDTDGELLEHRDGKRETGERTEQAKRIEPFDGSRSWETFPTEPPLCGGDDGLSKELDGITFPKWRKQSIKAYGNAIVPQVALQIFKAIQQNL
jgi:DNA (cytosine-5)-methyltransferase 1